MTGIGTPSSHSKIPRPMVQLPEQLLFFRQSVGSYLVPSFASLQRALIEGLAASRNRSADRATSRGSIGSRRRLT